jgi:hypothetical protein
MAGWNHCNANWQPKSCLVCNAAFTPKSGCHKFCSSECKGKWQYITGRSSTENQYTAISGNWKRYFSRLVGKKYRKDITVDQLLELLESQNGKCALSGIDLTCQLEVGVKFKTNASIDRIEAGGPYIKDNVQLVCSALNSWRSDTNLQEFIWWCKQVAKTHE